MNTFEEKRSLVLEMIAFSTVDGRLHKQKNKARIINAAGRRAFHAAAAATFGAGACGLRRNALARRARQGHSAAQQPRRSP